MSDDDSKAIGRIEGTLETLMATLQSWQNDHNDRHAIIDTKIEAVQADINKAKGGKGTLVFFTSVAVAAMMHAGNALKDFLK